MHNSPRAIIFDWDNTLVDTQYALNYALENTLRDMGHASQGNTNQRAAFSSRELYLRGIFQDKWQEANNIYTRYIKNSPAGNISLYDKVRDTLEYLVQDNIYLVIVSNKFGANLRCEVEEMQISQYFSAIIGSGDTAEDKPSVLPANTALKHINITPARDVWFIGDSITDMECARRLGVTKILYSQYKIHNVIPDFYISNYDEFLDIVNASKLQGSA